LSKAFSFLNILINYIPNSSPLPVLLAISNDQHRRNAMRSILKNQKGQGIMEYVIISSLVGICCLVAVKQFGGVVKERIEEMKERVTKEIRVTSSR